MDPSNAFFGYDPGDMDPKSPALSPVTVNYEPSSSPSPWNLWLPHDDINNLPFDIAWNTLESDSTSDTHAKRMRSNTDETDLPPQKRGKPHVLDSLLLFYMALNRPDIAMEADRLLPLITSFSTLSIQPTSTPSDNRSSPAKVHNRVKTRWGLPLTLNSLGGPSTVMACADTGSEENIISAELTQALGLTIVEAADEKRQFMLANGKIVEAVGQVATHCSFGIESSQISASMSCIFHVFLRLASPIIMGMAFLEQTETLTKHRDRLVRIPRPSLQALQVYSVGRPKKNLWCSVDKNLTFVTPDSGSEVDLMAPRFAVKRGFQIFHGEEQIEFADGSIAVTSGLVKAELSVYDVSTPTVTSAAARIPVVDFFLLDGLRADVLIGEDTLEELKIFTENQNSLISTSDATGPIELNRIRHIGPFDRILSWVKEKIGLSRQRGQNGSSVNNSLSDDNIDDQRENDRRERETARIAGLPSDQQENAIDAEGRRQAEYDNARRTHPGVTLTEVSGSLPPPSPMSPPFSTPSNGLFKCEYPGCTAPPFQTQYLLNSHTNVHGQSRPHYCPVRGCPRAEGGKGFKRENEMIRHGLVHESPGYICPFCPGDRERRYPRPDNLQRHVRVYHSAIDRNDPRMREVLVGPYGGHRRRVN